MANANEKEKPQQPAVRTRKTMTEDATILHAVKQYFKYAGAVVAIWAVGYNRFSPAWLLLGLVVYVWKEKNNKSKQKRIEISQLAAKNEKETILARVEDLPSWVFFPDVERAEWMNKMIDQMWPFIGDFVRDLLMTQVTQTVQSSAGIMASFKFVTIDLGDIPPRIGGVKVYTENVKRDEIYMDLDLIYSSDSEIEVKIKGITAGIKDLQLHGTLRVIFKPLLGKMPLFGGVSFFFLNNPTIDFNLTSLANALDLPGLNDMLQNIIQENIANIMVLPNRIAVPLAPGLDATQLRYPQPHGVLRIHVVEAKDLVKADVSLLGKGKSDPYVVVKVGAAKFKTKVIDNTLTPVWNEVFETVIDEKDGQFLDLEVRDEDPSKDDILGNVNMDLSQCAQKGMLDSWLPLENVKKGMVHLKLVWLYLCKDPMMLNKSIEKSKKDKRGTVSDELSSCLVMVNLDSARELPRVTSADLFPFRTKKLSEPDPYVEINVGHETLESKVAPNTTDPRWEQGFRFLVHEPNLQTVDIKILDKKTDKCLGELTYPLKNLLSAPDMVADQYFNLKKSEANSQIQMRLALRVLTTEYNPEWANEASDMMDMTEDGTPVDTAAGTSGVKDTTVKDKDAKTPAAPKPQDGKVSSSTPGSKTEPAKDAKQSPAPAPAPAKVIPPPSKAGNSDVRQRTSASSVTGDIGEFRLGKIQLTLRYSVQRQKLVVVVHKCVGLLACDKDHFSDPYVKMYLLPDKSSSSKRKTKVINNNLSPVYDETFEYTVSPQELATRQLEVMVKNDTSMFSSSQKELGVIAIDLSEMDTSKALTDWFDLRSCDDDVKRSVSIESDV